MSNMPPHEYIPTSMMQEGTPQNRPPQLHPQNGACTCGCGCACSQQGDRDGRNNRNDEQVVNAQRGAENESENEQTLYEDSEVSEAESNQENSCNCGCNAVRVMTAYDFVYVDEEGFRYPSGPMPLRDLHSFLFPWVNQDDGTHSPDSLLGGGSRSATPSRASPSIGNIRIGSPALPGIGTWNIEIIPRHFIRAPLRLTEEPVEGNNPFLQGPFIPPNFEVDEEYYPSAIPDEDFF